MAIEYLGLSSLNGPLAILEGVSGAAESTQALVFDMDNISQRMDENQRIAGDLQQETAIFKNL